MDTFNSLFTLQVATSIISLCAGVFVVAFVRNFVFSSLLEKTILKEDLPFQIKPNFVIDYWFYGITLFYVIMDILFLMYYGNEITLHRSILSTQLFRCNWVEQSIRSRKFTIISMEFLRHPKPLLFGLVILYPLTLVTFTMVRWF